MRRVIFKYELPWPDLEFQAINVPLPIDAEILEIDHQLKDQLKIWALVDPSAATEIRKFIIAATGIEIPETLVPRLRHLKTVLIGGGLYVFHVFEIVSYDEFHARRARQRARLA